MKNKKTNYGIDAPSVLMILFLVGAAFGLLGLFVLHYLKMPYAVIFFWYLIFTALSFWVMIPLMLLSSKIGKVRYIKQFVPSLGLKGNERVLDVGCGRGLVLNTIAKHLTSGKSVGIDIWNRKDQFGNHPSETTENALIEGVLEKVEVHTGNMQSLPFPDESFDLVISCLSLHNLPNEDRRRSALYEMMRVLKGDGKLIVIDFQHTQEYAKTLKEMGHERVSLSKKTFKMFPPTRVVTAEK